MVFPAFGIKYVIISSLWSKLDTLSYELHLELESIVEVIMAIDGHTGFISDSISLLGGQLMLIDWIFNEPINEPQKFSITLKKEQKYCTGLNSISQLKLVQYASNVWNRDFSSISLSRQFYKPFNTNFPTDVKNMGVCAISSDVHATRQSQVGVTFC